MAKKEAAAKCVLCGSEIVHGLSLKHICHEHGEQIRSLSFCCYECLRGFIERLISELQVTH
jgi:hypothetical protein